MIRNYIFPEEYGRNIIWVMLSGFFLKIGAKENSFGQIVMPKDHFLFNLDKKDIDNSYLNYKYLHYIFLDGAAEYLEDEKFKKIKSKVNIYYVGKLDNFWNNIKNSFPLYSDNINENLNTIKQVKKKYPIFFKKYFLKKLLTTINNFRYLELSSKHLFGKKKYVYYGYITPTKSHLNKFIRILNLDLDTVKTLFDFQNNYDLEYNVKQICVLKEKLIKQNNIKYLPYINELLLFLIRHLICGLLKNKDNFLIHNGMGGKKNFNAYEMLFGNRHIYLDFGSKVGFDKAYPRWALLRLSNRKTICFNLDQDFIFKDIRSSVVYLREKIDEFLNKLNIKF